MIVSHPLKVVFLHNPKAAGTTIRRTLLRYTSDNPYLYQGFTRSGDLQDMAHLRYDQLPTEVIARVKDERWLTFSVCRDPVSRFKSAVAEFLRQHGDWFAEFNLPLNKFLHLMLSPASIKHDWRFVHFCPQNKFFPPCVDKGPTFRLYAIEEIDLWWNFLWERLIKRQSSAQVFSSLELPSLQNLRPMRSQPAENSLILDNDMLHLIAFLYEDDYTYFDEFFNGNSPYQQMPKNINGVDLSLHCNRIEHIHRDRDTTAARFIHNGFDPSVTYEDERLNWDLLACFKQETLDLREGTQ